MLHGKKENDSFYRKVLVEITFKYSVDKKEISPLKSECNMISQFGYSNSDKIVSM